jgi:hypothetical protein
MSNTFLFGHPFLLKNIYYSNPLINNNSSDLYSKLQNIAKINTQPASALDTTQICVISSQETVILVIYRLEGQS